MLQRKCACGGKSGTSGECEECKKKRLQRSIVRPQPKLVISKPGDAFEQEADQVAGAFASHSVAPISKLMPGNNAEATEFDIALSTVSEVLQSSGLPLDPVTGERMTQRFGHDFSRVRVHTDARANESAQAVNANAYTVGQHIVFAAGRYAPSTLAGQKLLAHELTHVIQQNAASETWLQRQARRNPLEKKAKAIIARAKDAKVDAGKRCVQLVKDIIAEYYGGDAAKADSVVFDDAKAGSGLNTKSVGTGATTKGKISVGNYFLTNVDSFARRVLRVGHELEHIDQYRGGLVGGQNKNKREFLAFHDEALATEKPGTGRLSFATRLALIDTALGYYYCLSADDQKAFDSKKLALLKRRDEVNGKGGNAPTNPPTQCKTQ
jgi:hypothetical protein